MGPVTRAVASRRPGQRAAAVTLPCPYASGREGAHAGTMPGVERVMNFREAMRQAKEPGRSLVLQLAQHAQQLQDASQPARRVAPKYLAQELLQRPQRLLARPGFPGRCFSIPYGIEVET